MTMSNSPLVSYTQISPNKNSPRNKPIDRISIHCVVGQCSVEVLGSIFAPASRQASSNYGISPKGWVGMYVEEKDRSWCTSSGANDHRAVTIEVASDTTHPYAVTDTAFATLLDLCTDICQRNGKKKVVWIADKDKALAYTPAADEMVLTVHRWFANKSCPGDYLYNRHAEIVAEVNKRLGNAAPEQPQQSTPAQTTEQLYRVRKAWGDKASQKGAYKFLANAKACADANPGYNVYDASGAKVYPVEQPPATATPDASDEGMTDAEMYAYFKEQGLNDYGVAGLMGNLYAESGLASDNLQNTGNTKLGMSDAEYTEAVDGGTYTNFVKDGFGFGLAQWTYWSRKEALQAFIKAAGVSIGNKRKQCEFIIKELAGYKGVLDTLKTATSVRQASDAVLLNYERPANQSESVREKRASYGQKYFDLYAKGNATAPTTPEAPATTFTPYTVQVKVADLNIRKGPGVNYAATGKFTGKGIFTIVEEQQGRIDGSGTIGKWGRLKSGAGWICLAYSSYTVRT